MDRLNYQYTATLLSFAAITLAATQYVGKPIQCWVPPEFTGAWEKWQKDEIWSNLEPLFQICGDILLREGHLLPAH